jgi:N6-L-threonylcarbamoyladenine synthase
MICLGIESTAHTFGVGIADDKGKILANAKDVFTTKTGGIVPAKAAEHHVNVCGKVIKDALKAASLKISDIDLVAFSQSPGLGHTLRIGAIAARSLSLNYNKPLVGVNHCIAHLEIGRLLTKAKDPVLLYVSGANTQIIAYDAGKYRIFGESLDGGVGNFLDSFARELGLGFPGGPKIAELAEKGKNLIELPYVVKGMDVSFGGLLTNLKQKLKSGKYKKEDLAYSLQETVFAMLLEVSERAMAHCNKDELLLGGGVACNKRLQEMSRAMCRERKSKCYILPNEFNVDNGAMIAWLGIVMHNAGITTPIEKSEIRPYERTDDVKVKWR